MALWWILGKSLLIICPSSSIAEERQWKIIDGYGELGAPFMSVKELKAFSVILYFTA